MVFFFFLNFNRPYCEQTVKILIRRHIVRRLIRDYTVNQCPIKRTVGLNGLKYAIFLTNSILYKNIDVRCFNSFNKRALLNCKIDYTSYVKSRH